MRLLRLADGLEVLDLLVVEAERGKVRVGELLEALLVEGRLEVLEREGAAVRRQLAESPAGARVLTYNCRMSKSLRPDVSAAAFCRTASSW